MSTRVVAPTGGDGPGIGGAIPAANGGSGRKKWGGHGTAVVSALQKVDIASETITISKDEPKCKLVKHLEIFYVHSLKVHGLIFQNGVF